jgi:rhodanese-related sulfurtransferase
MENRRKFFVLLFIQILIVSCISGCGGSSSSSHDSASFSFKTVKKLIDTGSTSAGAADRVLIVDVRQSSDYINGHIKDSLSVPLTMISNNGLPVYTNGYDQLNTSTSTALADSWLCHMLVNQLVNDFASTYEKSRIIFYGSTMDEGRQAAELAKKIGYKNAYYLFGDVTSWDQTYPDYTQLYYSGVESVDTFNGSFVMTGFINNTNFENVSIYGTHHGIVYKGGGLHEYGLLQADMAPFPFQELLTYLGASPEGNMADGIYYGTDEEYAAKFVDGQRIDFEVTWAGASKYYTLNELYEEKTSAFQPATPPFAAVGIEPRIGGTRESNINWNPGCIFCFYSCVCGITSNAKSNDNIWFADGGTYDYTDDPRNYYAGRYYPRMNIFPGKGQAIKIKVTIVK